MRPDERAFRDDLRSADYLIGASEGRWGVVEQPRLPATITWPTIVLWVSTRANVEKFYFRFDLDNYPIQPPTGSFYDPESNEYLATNKRPVSRGRGAMVFRTDWYGTTALYHPYDRVASNSHQSWAKEYPHLVWDRSHTIVDLLEELHSLLNQELMA